MVIKHTKRGLKQDQRLRSNQNWERGRGARRIGNPRYKPVIRKGRKVYIVRSRQKKVEKKRAPTWKKDWDNFLQESI
jgi:hypothetical protein